MGLKTIIAALTAGASLVACGGGGGGGSQPAKPAAVAPTVDLSSSATAARAGDTITLSWTSQNATGCTASGSWSGARATSGSDAITLTDTGTPTYILTCSGAGGTGSDTTTLTAAAAMQQLTIPGAPAPINFAKGACVSTETADYSVKCLSTAADIATKYDTFTSDVSGRVTFTATTQPATTLGGACTAGFDRVQSRVSVDTTLLDYHLPMVGSAIAEVTYKPTLLASVSQGTISQMSALIFQDTSNTDLIGIIIAATVSGDPFTIATAGTISSSGAADLVQCISVDDTPTPPPPSGLTCTEDRGAGQNGLGFSGAISSSIGSSAANQTASRSVGWGVRYNDANRTADSYTGSLRVTLWAVSESFAGGAISGYKLFNGYPNFAGAGARSSSQIYNLYTYSNIQSSGTGVNPPAGNYCIVAALDQFSDTCTSSDGYCYVDWVQFDGAEEFQ